MEALNAHVIDRIALRARYLTHLRGIIIFDLDDTIVDRESSFVRAQLALLEKLKSFGVKITPKNELKRLRTVDSMLIRHYGKHMYDYSRLAVALWFVYNGKSVDEAVRLAVRKPPRKLAKIAAEARRKHDQAIGAIPSLMPGAKVVLNYLKKRYVLILLTEGRKRLQMGVVRRHNLKSVFNKVIVTESKGKKDFFQAKIVGLQLLKRKCPGAQQQVIVVGDRISEDIVPGNAISAKTIWIPGPYFPGRPVRPYQKPSWRLSSLSQLRRIL